MSFQVRVWLTIDVLVKVDAVRRHLQEQVALYGEQTLVNLVDQKGHEKPVKEAYERYVAEVSSWPSFSIQQACGLRLSPRPTFRESDTNTLTSTTNANTCAGIV